MDAQWKIRLFGRLCVEQEGQVITRFQTQKTAALLAYLAYHLHSVHPREVLADVLWTESPPETGRHRLRQAISSLRRQLEPPGVPQGTVIVSNRFSVRLNPHAITTDVAEFEAALQSARQSHNDSDKAKFLTAAADLYRGELLPGFYEDWVEGERARLSEAYFRAMRQLVKLLAQAHDFDRALDYAHRIVTADPLREESHRTLMRLYLAAGHPSAALTQFRELEVILKEQLRATPSATTREFVREIEKRAKGSRAKKQRATAASQPSTSPSQSSAQSFPQASPRTGNLPLQFTRFFGRETEIEQLRTMLLSAETRLITLTGSGGSGKTRLAIELAKNLRDEFSGGVWFVPLADLSDARLIGDTVLNSLRAPRSPNVEPMEQAADALSRQPVLLLMDNFEHLVEEGALIVQTLLSKVPTLKCLITSRRRLELTGEREFPVSPLPTPPQEYSDVQVLELSSCYPNTRTPEYLLSFPSVQLFVDRAQAVRPDFQVTKGNAHAMSELCRRLEGIPLTLELAAARAQVVTPAQMLAQLERRFDFLVSQRRGISDRHRTLRAAIEWSYRLLPPELQRFFTRLSVFRGGWSLEAAEAVCTNDGQWSMVNGQWLMKSSTINHQPSTMTLEALVQLRAHSLILSEESGAEMRYRMLETLREFAAEQLSPDEQAELASRQASYYLALAEEAEPELVGAEQATWLNRLTVEHDNVQAALEWVKRRLERPAESAEHVSEIGLRLVGALWRFWKVRGYFSEGRKWLSEMLERTVERTTGRAKALHGAGELAFLQDDYVASRSFIEESVAIYREIGDKAGLAHSLCMLGHAIRAAEGIHEKVRSLYEESLELCHELNDKRGMAAALFGLGRVVLPSGDYVTTTRFFHEQSLAIYSELGDSVGTAECLYYLGEAARLQDAYEEARTFYERSLSISRELGDRQGIAYSLYRLGQVAQANGDAESARSFFEDSLAILKELEDKYGMTLALHSLGDLASVQGDSAEAHSRYAAARSLYEEMLMTCMKSGNKQGVAERLEELAYLVASQGHSEQAVKLIGATQSLRKAVGTPLLPHEQQRQNEHLHRLRETLGETAFATAYETGRALTWEQTIAYALEDDRQD